MVLRSRTPVSACDGGTSGRRGDGPAGIAGDGKDSDALEVVARVQFGKRLGVHRVECGEPSGIAQRELIAQRSRSEVVVDGRLTGHQRDLVPALGQEKRAEEGSLAMILVMLTAAFMNE